MVSEVKFKGLVGVATQFFSTFKSAEQRRLLQASLPLSFGFALTIIDSRAKSVHQGDSLRSIAFRFTAGGDESRRKKAQRKGAPASAVL